VTQAFSLACTGPIVSMTGIAGFTLGGGLGSLSCDNLLAAEVVTAGGEIIHASETENNDLLWGLKGTGWNFGVVTTMELRLHRGPTVVAGLIYWPLIQFSNLVDHHRSLMDEFPDELTTWIFLRLAPPHPAIPKDWVGRPVVALALCHCGATEEGRVWAKRFADLNPAIASTVDEIEYRQWQRALDTRWGTGFFNDWRGHYLDDLDAEATHILTQHVERLTSPWTDIKIPHLGGAVARIADTDTAYGNRSARFGLVIQAPWERAEVSAAQIAWVRQLRDALAPHATGGAYANFLGCDETDRVSAAHGSKNMLRLRALKRKYDPANVFRLNPSVSPPC
jgi:Berberine and berberine like